MDNLKYLLKELNILNQRIIDREKNQDKFNVFDLMFKRSDERNLHSRFLSVLLDPFGSHKMDDLFLKIFIEELRLDFHYDLSSLETYPNESNRSELHKIDILLIDRKHKSAVIIENKIWAKDSNHETEGQLERYFRCIKEEIPADSISVIYLSVDRDSPSDDSVGKSGLFPDLKDKVININYGTEILDWLRKCVKECYNKPSLRETISQYIKLIEEMTNNDISEEDIKSIMKLVGKNTDNLMSAKLLIDNSCNLYKQAISQFWKELKDEFLRHGYKIRGEGIEDKEINKLVKHRKVYFNLGITCPSGIKLTINADDRCELCVGMIEEDAKGIKSKAERFFRKYEKSLGLEGNDYWLFYKIIRFKNSYGLVLSNFSDDNTFVLISETERKKTIHAIVEQTDALSEDFMNFKTLK